MSPSVAILLSAALYWGLVAVIPKDDWSRIVCCAIASASLFIALTVAR